MFPSLPRGSVWLQLAASRHLILGVGLSGTGTGDTLMGLARFGGVLREFSGLGENGGDQRESPLGRRAVALFPWSQCVARGIALRQGWGGWAQGRG